MAKRSITDAEIGLIKAMLARGMANDKVHFYFNHPDRLISSGRITQIKQGKYGVEITAASEADLDEFLTSFKTADIILQGGVAPEQAGPTEIARALFERGTDGHWRLKLGETDEHECKKDFDFKKISPLLRAIAALSNNRGGFVFLGVSDVECRAEGVCEEFEKFDIAKILDKAKTHLSPTPRITAKGTIDLEGINVGFIQVAPHPEKPVIVCRDDGEKLNEGEILFRYAGQSARIKYGDLQQIIAYREHKAVAEFANRMSRVSMGAAATLDLDTGKVEGRVGSFMIGEELLPKIQFIREGQFTEKDGAPALRLIGDVQSTGSETRIVRAGITTDAALRNFLKNENVEEPLQYLLHSAHSTREWVPIWFFMRAAKVSIEEAVELLRAEPASQPTHREKAIERLQGKISAFKLNPGGPKKLVKEFEVGNIQEPTDEDADKIFALASQGISKGQKDIERFRGILLGCLNRSNGNSAQHKNRRSSIYRAACRLDELLYGNNVSN